MKLKRMNISLLCKLFYHFLYNAHLRVSDSRKSKQIHDIALSWASSLGRCSTMILSFTTETAYLSLKLVGSLHKQTSPGIVMVTTNATCNFEGHHS